MPSNLLQIPNSESNSQYLQYCKDVDVAGHPARFPERLPSFFIEMLTDPGDLVIDIFAGSNTTGHAAEELRRKWLGFELRQDYAAASIFRFLDDGNSNEAKHVYDELCNGQPNEYIMTSPQLTLAL